MLDLRSVLFPQRNFCHVCGRFLPVHHLLCPVCLADMDNKRFKQRESQTHLPPLQRCVSVFEYAGVAREAVHLLKYQSDCMLAELLGEALAYSFAINQDLFGMVDGIVPVPLAQKRLQERGYNQAALLTDALCRYTQLQVPSGVLIRIKDTNSQIHRSRERRKAAMRGAFAVLAPNQVAAKHWLLVDDVLTTGATALACTEALQAAGAQSVSLLTVCKVSKLNPNL